jgi:uncharacterized short protein YbdD (DUF466 family)
MQGLIGFMKIKKIFQFFKLVKSHLNGDFAYQNYLEKLDKTCENQVLSKKEFLLKRQNEKFKKVSRCC